MIEIRQTDSYRKWHAKLRDQVAKARIDVRLIRLSQGNPGDVRPVGEGVSELRIDYGPGYRIYFVRHGEAVVILLAGGVKKSQPADIKLAVELARKLRAGEL
jgi:putative addiction module killer protein